MLFSARSLGHFRSTYQIVGVLINEFYFFISGRLLAFIQRHSSHHFILWDDGVCSETRSSSAAVVVLHGAQFGRITVAVSMNSPNANYCRCSSWTVSHFARLSYVVYRPITKLAVPQITFFSLCRAIGVPEGTAWNKTDCKKDYGFIGQQYSLCRRHLPVMKFVSEAVGLTKEQCKLQMKDRRWNCSSIDKAPVYMNDLKRGA